MYDRTYRGVSLIATNYFKLLCGLENLHGTYDAIQDDPEGLKQSRITYTISLSSRQTYDLMQKVLREANS
jgi:hypothetical protein